MEKEIVKSVEHTYTDGAGNNYKFRTYCGLISEVRSELMDLLQPFDFAHYPNGMPTNEFVELLEAKGLSFKKAKPVN